MIKWSIREIELPLKFTWKISRNSSQVKKNFIVEANSTDMKGIGEVAFNVRYGESSDKILKEFEAFSEVVPKTISTIDNLQHCFSKIKISNSLRFGIESAFVHYLATLSEKSVPELLGINTINQVKTSFSIPIMPAGDIEAFIKEHHLNRFCSLKMKVSDEEAYVRIKEVEKHFNGNIRIDANEGFEDPDQVITFLERLGSNCPIEFLEQPMPAAAHDEYLYLKEKSPVDIMADESVCDGEINQYFEDRFHSVNIKLMKSGGYFKAVKQIREAKSRGLKVMIGCMIETSLGISSAMNISYGADYCDLDGSLIIEKDPYDFLIEENGKIFMSHMQ